MPISLAWYDRLLPYAPFATALIALGALCTAIGAIAAQKSIARKRAAIDFFLKTDLDQNMLEAHREFEAAVILLKAHLATGGSIEDFSKTNEHGYRHIWKYLNIHELVAVGIKNGVFDEQVCYNFWGDGLIRHAEETAGVIDHEIKHGAPSAYFEFRKLSAEWSKRARIWREKQAKKQRANVA